MDDVNQKAQIPQYNDSHYAVVDLGSNSFHLLITQRQTDHSFIAFNKVKQKVRLAAGLDAKNNLTDEAMKRGLACLTLFSQHLKMLPLKNIIIVATATLRLASNSDDFLIQANAILPKNIQLLSGVEEAETIFLGATCGTLIQGKNTHVEPTKGKLLVLDIGGASTELIIGEGKEAKKSISIDIGCVSFTQRYFSKGILNQHNFSEAIAAASQHIKPFAQAYQALGWQHVVGNSGTIQALAEILAARKKHLQQPLANQHFDPQQSITFDFLLEIQHDLINFQHIDNIYFEGLRVDRCAVLASGLAILIALFNCLIIDNLKLSSGALREGLLYKLSQ